MRKLYFLVTTLLVVTLTAMGQTYHQLSAGPLTQNWTNTSLITTNDNWSGISSIRGFLGQDLTTGTGTDPQSILTGASLLANDLDVIANQTSTGITNGGVAEFHITNPTIALQGSGTADAPYVAIYLNTVGVENINVQYLLRDLDGTADNAVQPVALQYRIGNSGNFTNIPAAFVADATSGPSLATQETAVTVYLPAACEGQEQVEIRIITTNAANNDEWVGIDDIVISTSAASSPMLSVTSGANGSEPSTNGTFTFSLSAPAPTGGVMIQYSLSGSATAGTDYSNTQVGSITIPAGSSTGTITLNTVDDTEYEGTEKITITLTSATGGYLLAGSTASIDLLDNDAPPPATVVINQVYGGGGNGDAFYTNDFIELYNYGNTPVSLNGWSVQYASSTGGSWQVTTLSGTIPAHSFYLVQEAKGSGGIRTLPAYNATGTINMSGSAGKVVLSNSAAALTGENPSGATVIDKVGYGAASGYELAPAPGTTSTTSVRRAIDGVDNNNNSADFVTGDPLPRNTTYKTSAPVVYSLMPPNGHADAPASVIPVISFDKPVQKGTGNITILENGAPLTTIDVTSANVVLTDRFTATINTTLSPGKTYAIQIAPGAFTDVYGNGFAGITNTTGWNFTTYNSNKAVAIPATFDFQVCLGNGLLPMGFTRYSESGAQQWDCSTFGRNSSNGLEMNGFDGSNNIPNVDWLISPKMDLSGTTYPLLSFWSRRAFSGKSLQLKVSTDYTGGDPALATWKDLNGKFADETVTAWTESKDINLSLFKEGNVHIAFVYTSSTEDGSRWTLDDISVINSSTPPPPSLTLGSTDVQFGFTAKGATSQKTFTFVGNDLTGDVSLSASGPFLLSKDGSSYSTSISYTVADANNVEETVWVRFAPTEKNEDFSGTVTVSTSGLTRTVTMKGTSINPAYTLEVVNWNVEWFGSPLNGPGNDDQQAANVLKVFQSLDADIYALGEIVSEERLAGVVNSMPGYAYVISNYGSHTNTSLTKPSPLAEAQKLAFVYKTSVIKNLGTKALLSKGINTPEDLTNEYYSDWASGRFPFLMDAEVTLNCVTKNVKFVMVHAKANTDPITGSYDRRKEGADGLHTLLNTEYANDNIVLLGDFNDDLDQTITAGRTGTSWSAFTNDAINFTALTLPLSEAGKKSTVSHNDVIDHVVVSSEMDTYYMTATANIVTDVTSLVSNYGNTTSDHYPVFTRYRFEEPAINVVIPDTYVLPQGTKANAVYTGYKPASSITLTAEASDGTPVYTYNWEDGTTGASLTVSPTAPTEYTVTVTDANGCTATASKEIQVIDVRTGRNGDKVLVCHKYPRKNATLEVGQEGVADHLTHGDELGSCGMDASITQKAERAEPGMQLVLEALPNPSTGVFTLSFRGGEQAAKAQLVVTDMLGRVVETRNNLQTNATYTLGSDYRNGVYLVSVLHNGERFTLKLVKQ